MVRINLIDPKKLADQHLVAEYNEILMLLGYVKRHPEKTNIPESYRLGRGHIRFFKDKLAYLKERHEAVKKEMRARSFKTDKSIDLASFPQNLVNSWKPSQKDKEIILHRLREKINLKPTFYRYYGKKASKKFLLGLLE